MDAIQMTPMNEIFRHSAMRKAAAPSTGGEMIAPSPPAAGRTPGASLTYPDFASIGQGADPTATVEATPLRDGAPSRNDESTTVRPAADRLRPITDDEKSMKNSPAPEYWRIAP